MHSLIFLWVWEDLPLQLKRPAREADHLPPSSANVKKDCSPTSTLPIRLHVVRKDKFGFKFLRCDAGCERVPDDPKVRVALSKLKDKERLPLTKNATKSFQALGLPWVSGWSCLHWTGVKYKPIRKITKNCKDLGLGFGKVRWECTPSMAVTWQSTLSYVASRDANLSSLRKL